MKLLHAARRGRTALMGLLALSAVACGSTYEPRPGKISIDAESKTSMTLRREYRKPRVLVLMDRSCSMKNKSGGANKWDSAVEAVTTVLEFAGSDVHFGLDVFPSSSENQCEGAQPVTDIGSDGSSIATKFLAQQTQSSGLYHPSQAACTTPIAESLEMVVERAAADPDQRPDYVFLVTDGQIGSCEGEDASETRQNIVDTVERLAKSPEEPIHTIVLSFDGSPQADWLDLLATVGGQPASEGAERFYDVQAEADLAEVLDLVTDKESDKEAFDY